MLGAQMSACVRSGAVARLGPRPTLPGSSFTSNLRDLASLYLSTPGRRVQGEGDRGGALAAFPAGQRAELQAGPL